MKKLLFIFATLCLSFSYAHAQLIAFPGAQGFGKFAKGARASSSPTVYRVTNLNDSGTGSFRDAVSSSNRIVVFDVAGVIKITSRIVVSSNIYIAGQTAPGEGITVYGNGFSYSGANNVICRYLRMRMGAVGDSGKDACGIANGSNMIFDHVSVSWGRDETFSISGSECINITIQNSVISQGLLSHSAGGLIQTDGGVTLYRNLYVDNDTRNNKIKGVNQYVNNLVYNWSSGAYIMGGDSEGDSYANCESNMFINGPANSVAALGGGNTNYHIYADDNWWDKNRNGIVDGYLVPKSEYSGGPDFQTVRYNYPVVPKWSALSLVDSLLPYVGASLPYRDLQDCYVVNEVRSFGKKGKFITNENELSIGIPTSWNLWTGSKRIDSDNDGIPDAWESANGLNPNLASDAVAVSINGYLNIENYINSITPAYSQEFLRAPLNLVTDSTSQNNIYLTWFDFTDKETGYCVEQKINGTFTEIARTTKNGNTFTVSGLTPEQTVILRVRAFNDGGYSTYSNELTVKTKPVPVAVTDLATFVPDLTWTGATDTKWDKSTLNWNNGSSSVIYTDNSKILLPETSAATTINVTEPVTIGTMVINSPSNYSIQGTGYLTGSGSVNKTGEGKLTLSTENTYTGATVLYGGILEIAKLANGSASSSIGSSQNYNFNFVLKGGKVNYTGASVTSNRNIALEGNAEFGISNSAAIVTLSGLMDGTGSLTKSGLGTLLFKGINAYQGPTTINEGTIEYNGIDNINASMAASKTYILNGGKLKTSGGSTSDYENYYSPIIVADGKTSTFEPYRNCYIYSKVSGNGILNFNITYLREYIQGDWSQFSGTVNANGNNATDGSQFMLNNTVGIPNGRIVTSGNARIVCWKNASTMSLGGLSGPSGTYLSGADKQNNSSTMTWIVGGAGTDETFNGVINNECSNNSYKGTTTIIKEGNGYWKLTGANIYKGSTTIKDGMLIVNGTQTGTGKVTVMADATLAGKGTIPAVTEVQSGGILQPGDPTLVPTNNFGTITLGSLTLQSGSQTNMEVNRTLKIYDKVAVTGAVTVGGTLNITLTGTPVEGDQYPLFTGTSFSGSFNKIIPETPGEGLIWNFSGGILKVVSGSNAINYINDSKVTVFPNFIESVTDVTLDKFYNNVNISVVDLKGSTVLNKQVSSEKVNLNLSKLSKGFYFIKIQAGNEIDTVKKISKI